MNFFEHQEKAKKQSSYLIGLFFAALIAISTGLYFVVIFVFLGGGPSGLWYPEVFWGTLVTVGCLVGVVNLYKIFTLSSGGGVVAEAMGGRLVSAESAEPLEKRLMNVVEEMAIASGVPMPQVYLLDDEEGINAFAAGYTPEDAAVAVTRGALDSFTREELQGVIAHEFSHIYNGDMRLNIRLIGALAGIVAIATIGRIMIRVGSGTSRRRRRGKEKGSIHFVFAGLAVLLIGWIGTWIARLIQSAVSRQREYLADASAVQFTRNPAGIGGALRKIHTHVHGGALEGGEEIAHMCIASPAATSGFFGGGSWMATHPPLEDRIERIDGIPVRAIPSETNRDSSTNTPGASGFVTTAVTAKAGQLSEQAVHQASDWLAGLDPRIRNAAGSGLGAFVLGTLLLQARGTSPSVVTERLERYLGRTEKEEALRLWSVVQLLEEGERTRVAHLSATGLKRLSTEQVERVARVFHRLALEDGVISLEEACILAVVEGVLEGAGTPRKKAGSVSLPSIEILLSRVAYAGADSVEGAQQAFLKGADQLPPKWRSRARLRMETEAEGEALIQAVHRIRKGSISLQENILAGCENIIRADGKMTEREVQVIRSIAGALGVPVPFAA